MSSVIGYSVYANYPRIFVRDTDKTDIVARTDDADGWKTYWDNRVLSYVTTLKGQTDATVCGTNEEIYSRFMCLALWGWVESEAAAHNKLLSAAKYLAQTTGIWLSWTYSASSQSPAGRYGSSTPAEIMASRIPG